MSDLREDWMRHADQVLADEQMVAAVYEALGKRHPKSRSRGRLGTPAEVVLRLLILKHIRNWSYGVLEREVRANLVYRDFTRVGGAKTPDAKTMGRWGVALGGDVIKQIYTRMVTMAQSHGLTEGRRMRVDTTVVETNIHHPTDFEFAGRRRAGAHSHHEEADEPGDEVLGESAWRRRPKRPPPERAKHARETSWSDADRERSCVIVTAPHRH